jgi:hypothetical protein
VSWLSAERPLSYRWAVEHQAFESGRLQGITEALRVVRFASSLTEALQLVEALLDPITAEEKARQVHALLAEHQPLYVRPNSPDSETPTGQS